MIHSWFAHVRQQPDLFRILHQDPPADPIIREACRRIKALQVGNDVELLRQFAPTLPEAELEPLGEVLRSSLVTLALWWLDHPDVSQDVPVTAMVRVCRGLLLASPPEPPQTAPTVRTTQTVRAAQVEKNKST